MNTARGKNFHAFVTAFHAETGRGATASEICVALRIDRKQLTRTAIRLERQGVIEHETIFRPARVRRDGIQQHHEALPRQ